MQVENGELETQSKSEILNAMIADAAEQFDTSFSDSEYSVVRTFYDPVAEQLAELQEQSSVVLQSSQIDNAQGQALDFLCALIGVQRQEPSRATGEVTFYREEASETRDYGIPGGTLVRTDGSDPIYFRTTSSATLEQGTTEVDVSIEAEDRGSIGNVSSDTITVIRDSIAGIDGVFNNNPTTGGSNEESDIELRQRAKNDLAQGSSSTAKSLITSVGSLEDVSSVRIFKNDGTLGDMPGWELVVHGGNPNDIGQEIADKIAAGDTPYGGNYGTGVSVNAELPNGQDWEIEFSRPEEINIYVDTTISINDKFLGEENVKDSIVDYIGGVRSTGNTVEGQISVGNDVLYGEVEYAIRDVAGVYDVEELFVDIESPPTGTSNISIEDFEVALTDALDDSITIETVE